MKTIGLFWGSNTGNQEEAVGFLKDYMVAEGCKIEEFNIADTEPSKMLDYKELDFTGKQAAFFGCGDQVGYSDNFLDAIGLLAKPFMANGGKLVERWPTEGYDFDLSLALDGDDFLGLGLDNDNQDEETEERLIIWAELIKDEFGL